MKAAQSRQTSVITKSYWRLRLHLLSITHIWLGTESFLIDENAFLLTINRYADVEHAVCKITSGYRFVLTYNLIKGAGAEPQSAASLDESTLPLCKFLSAWKKAAAWRKVAMTSSNHTVYGTFPNLLCHTLEHKYTDANLRLDHLKGEDARVAKAFYDASEKSDFTFLLANMELMVDGACADDGAEYGADDSQYIEEEFSRKLELD